MAAWAFGAAGLGADAGLSTAVVYGVLVFVASLPGAVVLLVGRPGTLGRLGTARRSARSAHRGSARPTLSRRPGARA